MTKAAYRRELHKAQLFSKGQESAAIAAQLKTVQSLERKLLIYAFAPEQE